MRPFHAVIIGHCVASWAALGSQAWFRWMFGVGFTRYKWDMGDTVQVVLYPLLQVLLVPYYLVNIPFRFDGELAVNVTSYAIILTVTIYLLLRRGRRRRTYGLCPSCSYDLTGNVSGVCPECGTEATAGSRAPARR